MGAGSAEGHVTIAVATTAPVRGVARPRRRGRRGGRGGRRPRPSALSARAWARAVEEVVDEAARRARAGSPTPAAAARPSRTTMQRSAARARSPSSLCRVSADQAHDRVVELEHRPDGAPAVAGVDGGVEGGLQLRRPSPAEATRPASRAGTAQRRPQSRPAATPPPSAAMAAGRRWRRWCRQPMHRCPPPLRTVTPPRPMTSAVPASRSSTRPVCSSTPEHERVIGQLRLEDRPAAARRGSSSGCRGFPPRRCRSGGSPRPAAPTRPAGRDREASADPRRPCRPRRRGR